MIVAEIARKSGYNFEDFKPNWKNKHLPSTLRYMPQHIIYDNTRFNLVYFKPSYDPRFIGITRDEIESIRIWNANIMRTMVMVYNYKSKQYTTFDMNEINRIMFSCKREGKTYLFVNTGFKWRDEDVGFELF